MAKTPITDANSLLASLQILLAAPHTQKPKTQEILNNVVNAVNKAVEELTALSEFVPLDIKEEEENFEGYSLWENFDGGLLLSKDQLCSDLIKKSPTLTDLKKAGITIKSIYKFKDDELAIADSIGDNFRQCNYEISELKEAVFNNKYQTYFYWRNYQNTRKLLEGLKRNNLFASYSFALLDLATKKYIPQEKNVELIKLKLDVNQKVRVEFEGFKKEYSHLLMGDWFNAYTYSNIREQLNNYEIKFELFTKVAYEAPPEVINSAGDFDVLARIGKQILFIECKSGKIGNDNIDSKTVSPEIRKVLRKSDELSQLFKKVKAQIEHFTSWLIFNPQLKQNKSVKTLMQGTTVFAFDPSEVRGAVVDIINQINK